MAIDVVYFAWVREAIGMGAERVTPPAHVVTIADLIGWLRGSSEGHGRAFADITWRSGRRCCSLSRLAR